MDRPPPRKAKQMSKKGAPELVVLMVIRAGFHLGRKQPQGRRADGSSRRIFSGRKRIPTQEVTQAEVGKAA